eukprot:UN24796
MDKWLKFFHVLAMKKKKGKNLSNLGPKDLQLELREDDMKYRSS